MAQNKSTAVMSNRIEPTDSLDHFPMPPWATRALNESFSRTYASDIHDCGIGAEVKDFKLNTFDVQPDRPGPVEWIPPCEHELTREKDYHEGLVSWRP